MTASLPLLTVSGYLSRRAAREGALLLATADRDEDVYAAYAAALDAEDAADAEALYAYRLRSLTALLAEGDRALARWQAAPGSPRRRAAFFAALDAEDAHMAEGDALTALYA